MITGVTNKIGIMLHELREGAGVQAKDLARGMLSVSELSKLEAGTRDADYIILDALFQRLGKSLDKLELIVSCEDYRLLSLQDFIEESIAVGDTEGTAFYLDAYRKCADPGKNINIQYEMLAQAVSGYFAKRNMEETLHALADAMKITYPEWNDAMWNENVLLCIQELRILLMIAYLKMSTQRQSESRVLIEQIRFYVEKHIFDEEELVKIYPHTMYLLGLEEHQLGNIGNALDACERGLKCLSESGSLIMMAELLSLQEKCLSALDRQEEKRLCVQYQEAVAFLYELAGEKRETEVLALLMQSSIQREYAISNEMLQELRNAQGLSQMELSEEVCAWETLAKIEGGKRSPNKKNFLKMMKKMGVQRGNYYGFIESEHFYLHEMVRTQKRYISRGENDKADQLLSDIKKNIDMSLIPNQQFILTAEIRSQLASKQITNQQAIDSLKELLYLTMPPIQGKDMVYRVPYRQEFVILNNIALCYGHMGMAETELAIYRQIKERYDVSQVSMKYHAAPGLIFYTNYTGALEENNELEKADSIGLEGISQQIRCGRGDSTGGILANLSCVYGKQGRLELEEKALRYAILLSALYKRKYFQNMLQKIYNKKYKEQI